MTDPTVALREIFDNHPAAPFLFVGSGFSRRYLGLEDWAGLLSRFCAPIKEFAYYRAKAGNNLPLAASFMADDYYEWWWTADETSDSRDVFAGFVTDKSDPLKYEMAKYLSSFALQDVQASGFSDEIAAFADISVDGIITTNWDSLIEECFPDYTVYVGQNELLFSNPQSIAEIYKIHGTATDPQSMVLTEADYNEFAEKNPYLAAKLVTIFVEHPIVFIGYSINDPHIQSIIMSIAKCLPQSKVAEFEQNLIFIQRVKGGEDPSIEKTTLQSGSFNVSLMVAKVTGFDQVYASLSGRKRKVPARLLRFFKEQMYDFVQAPEASGTKLAVVDFDRLSEIDDIEFVVGVGVAARQNDLDTAIQDALAKRGYSGVTADDVFSDVVQPVSNFEANALLEGAYPALGRSNRTFLPVFRYVRAVGINSVTALAESGYLGAKKVVGKLSGQNYFFSISYKKRFDTSFAGKTTRQIIEDASTLKEALLMLPFQNKADINVEDLRGFLAENSGAFVDPPYITAYRKLVCLYDKLAFGFDAE